MNTDPSRRLRLMPATRSDTRLVQVTGRIEAHTPAGHTVNTPPSTQAEVSSDAARNEPIRMLRLAQVATMTGLSKAKVYDLASICHELEPVPYVIVEETELA